METIKKARRHRKWSGFYWMAITADEYGEPLAVGESARELAEMLGVTEGTVLSCEHRNRSGRNTNRKIIKIWGKDTPEPTRKRR